MPVRCQLYQSPDLQKKKWLAFLNAEMMDWTVNLNVKAEAEDYEPTSAREILVQTVAVASVAAGYAVSHYFKPVSGIVTASLALPAALAFLIPKAHLKYGICMMASPPPIDPADLQTAEAVRCIQNERFIDLLLPNFRWNSVIVKISLVQLGFFLLSLYLGQGHAAPTMCSVYALGASWGPSIAMGEIHRLIMPVFLHASLMHLYFNMMFQLRLGLSMERQFGATKFLILYFGSAFFGNMVSAYYSPYKLAVGASTAGFGFIGVWIAELLLSWEMLPANKKEVLIYTSLMILPIVGLANVMPNIDIAGHLAGGLGGFLLAIILADMAPENQPPYYIEAKRAALGMLFLVIGSCGFNIFCQPHPMIPAPDCKSLWQLLAAPAAPLRLIGEN